MLLRPDGYSGPWPPTISRQQPTATSNPQPSGTGSAPSTGSSPTTGSSPSTGGDTGLGNVSAMSSNFTQQQANDALYNNFSQFTSGKSINQSDLQNVANNPDASTQDQQAAEYYLQNPYQLAQLDGGTNPDQGSFTQNQVGYQLEQMAASNIGENFSSLNGGSPNGTVTTKELNAALQNPNTDPALADSINFLDQNPGYLDDLDTASQQSSYVNPTPDGKISQSDISTVLNPNRTYAINNVGD